VKTATISRLKASLSEYLVKVRAGEELIVTDRGRPVAKIVPLKRDDLAIPARLLQMERSRPGGAVRSSAVPQSVVFVGKRTSRSARNEGFSVLPAGVANV